MMKIIYSLTLVLFLVFSALPLEASAGRNIPEEALDRYIEAKVMELNIPGIAIAIARGDEILYSRVHGSDIQTETRFYIGSVSKSFTALAIMQLVEKGKIELDNSVSTYIQEFSVSDDITVRHLLHHTSGMTEYEYMSKLPHSASFAEMVLDMNSMTLSYPPGEQFSYFNPNYSLLGMIVERVSGKPYAIYIDENIFNPLDLEHTSAQGEVDVPGHLSFFGFSVTRFEPFIQHELPAGYITSSAEDMVRYLEVLRTRQPVAGVSAQGIDQMQTDDSYGMGWVSGRFAGRPAVYHGGALPGFYAQAIMLVEDEYSIVLLLNKGHILNGLFTYSQFTRDIVSILTAQDPPGGLPMHRIMQILLVFFVASALFKIVKLISLMWGSKKYSLRGHLLAAAVSLIIPAVLFLLVPLGVQAFLQRGFTWQLAFLVAPDMILWFFIGMGFTIVEGLLHFYLAVRHKGTAK
jgi:CubicO group peptidase (beta-lactamase class C family)